MEIRTNYMVVITPKMNFLQIPIKDKYFVPPTNPIYYQRGTEYAEAKGLLSPSERRTRTRSDSRGLPIPLSAALESAGDFPPVSIPPESAAGTVH
jgi:hypothetical protein